MKCTLCGSLDLKILTKPFRGGTVYVCGYCKNALTVPHSGIKYDETDFEFSNYEDLKNYAKKIMEYLLLYKKNGRLLDIGCGSGYLLEEAEKSGFETIGIDPSPAAEKFCRKRNLKVIQGFLTGGSFSSRKFDVVVASHVLEHVEDPVKFLSVCRDLLDWDGILFLAQTNFNGTIPGILGRFWEGWVPKEHYYHFSQKGIRFILQKAKLKTIKIHTLPLGYHPVFNLTGFREILGSIYYTVNYLFSNFNVWPGFIGDQMYVLASR